MSAKTFFNDMKKCIVSSELSMGHDLNLSKTEALIR